MRRVVNKTRKLPQIAFEALGNWEKVKIIAALGETGPCGFPHWHVAHDGLANRSLIVTD